MNNNIQNQSSVPLSQQLGFKLFMLFIASFVIFFLLFSVYGVFTAYRENREAEQNVVLVPKPIVIDPQMRERLARVLAYEDAEIETASVRDPFQDRAGLSGLAARQGLSPATGTGTGTGTTTTAATSGGTTRTTVASSTGGGVVAPAAPTTETPTATEATRLRYNNWIERARSGYAEEIDPRVFAIEDLLPVGIVDGGSGQQEVLFYSETAARTFSFPVGTMFHDGWLTELRPEGVVFSYGDVQRTVRMRSWARSLRAS